MISTKDHSTEQGVTGNEDRGLDDSIYPILFSEIDDWIPADYYLPIYASEVLGNDQGRASEKTPEKNSYKASEKNLEKTSEKDSESKESVEQPEYSDLVPDDTVPDDTYKDDVSGEESQRQEQYEFNFEGYTSLYDALTATRKFLISRYLIINEQGNKVLDRNKVVECEKRLELQDDERIVCFHAFVKVALLDKYAVTKKKNHILKTKEFRFVNLFITNRRLICIRHELCKEFIDVDKSQIRMIQGVFTKNSLLGVKDSQISIQLYDERKILINQYFYSKGRYEEYMINLNKALLEN